MVTKPALFQLHGGLDCWKRQSKRPAHYNACRQRRGLDALTGSLDINASSCRQLLSGAFCELVGPIAFGISAQSIAYRDGKLSRISFCLEVVIDNACSWSQRTHANGDNQPPTFWHQHRCESPTDTRYGDRARTAQTCERIPFRLFPLRRKDLSLYELCSGLRKQKSCFLTPPA